MVVYIEQVIIDNLVINYLLLWIVSLILKSKKSRLRFFLASLVGTVFAVMFPFFAFDGLFMLLLKLLLGALIILVAFNWKNVKKFALELITFLASTFVLGGVVFGLLVSLFSNLQMENGILLYTSQIPIGVFVGIGFLFFKLLFDVIGVARKRVEIENLKFQVELYLRKRVFLINAFLDTGNLLCDEETGMPIVVIGFNTFKKLFGISSLDFLKGNYKIEKSKYIPVTEATKVSKMLVFEIDGLKIKMQKGETIVNKAMLGLSLTDFSSKLSCDAIFGNKILNWGKNNA